jgi:hypothetical protein
MDRPDFMAQVSAGLAKEFEDIVESMKKTRGANLLKQLRVDLHSLSTVGAAVRGTMREKFDPEAR